MLTESCVMFFFAVSCCFKRYFARWILSATESDKKKKHKKGMQVTEILNISSR